MIFSYDQFAAACAAACDTYEYTAPAVADYIDDLYRRATSAPHTVTLADLAFMQNLTTDAGLMSGNYAQNALAHHLTRTGQSTEGIADH